VPQSANTNHRKVGTRTPGFRAERTEQKIKIDWQFSIQTARSKLNSQYVVVQPANKKFKET
jgi:hypothetical protein